jgi:ABC-type thiamin/hydroxymethylpyrimidine transport system permease subunit
MKRPLYNINSIYYRLIALWVLCEAMLGGIIHGFKLPISGLIVGSGAVVCITLIAFYVPTKGSIIKATVMVAVFKMMLSPQSPPPAYIAVFFQGLMGELLFIQKKTFKVSCVILAISAMLESAIQRILVLTILYGTTFWKAIDEFISKLTGEQQITTYSIYFAIGYIIIHIIAGIIVGWFTATLPSKIAVWKNNVVVIDGTDKAINAVDKKQQRKKIKLSLLLVWFALIVVYIQSAIPIGKPFLSPNIVLQVFVRSILVVLSWHLFVRPLVNEFLQNWLKKKQEKEQTTIQQVTNVLPSVQNLIEQSWQLSSSAKGIKRLVTFAKNVTVNIVYAA